jgi:hypothetical protein
MPLLGSLIVAPTKTRTGTLADYAARRRTAADPPIFRESDLWTNLWTDESLTV